MRARTKPWLRLAGITALLVTLAMLAACGDAGGPARRAVDVQPDDICAVCGMELSRSPGPRAQAWIAGRARPLLFDSTRDFFAYVLQPENQSGLQDMFVQDSARIDWQRPGRDAATFIDARSAVYVAWQPLTGSMGPTFAPFSTRAAAQSFVRRHGGAVLGFDEVTPNLVATLQDHCPAGTVDMGGRAIACHGSDMPPAVRSATAPPLHAPHGGVQSAH